MADECPKNKENGITCFRFGLPEMSHFTFVCSQKSLPTGAPLTSSSDYASPCRQVGFVAGLAGVQLSGSVQVRQSSCGRVHAEGLKQQIVLVLTFPTLAPGKSRHLFYPCLLTQDQAEQPKRSCSWLCDGI